MTFIDSDFAQRHGLTGALAAAAAHETARTHAQLVDAAIADGRVSSNRRAFWLNHLRKAPEDVELLAAMAAPSQLPADAWPDR